MYKIYLNEGEAIVKSLEKGIKTSKRGLNKETLEKIYQDIDNTMAAFSKPE